MPSPFGADVLARIAQIIMRLTVDTDLTTIIPSLLQQRGLALILQRTLTKWLTQPRIKAARMHTKPSAHGTNGKDQSMLSNEGILLIVTES